MFVHLAHQEFPESLGLDLADSLAGQAVNASDFIQRPFFAVIDAETVSDGETSEMSEEIAADANNEISEAEGFAKDIDNEEPAR